MAAATAAPAPSGPTTGPAAAANAGYSLPVAIALAEAAQGPPPPPKPDIYQSYDSQGAMGNLFAPAFIRGYKPSEDAVATWNAAHTMSRADVDATAMPGAWRTPQAVNPLTYGRSLGGNYGFAGTNKAMVDPAALRAEAQGTAYDSGARRAAIAQQLAANQAASDSYVQQHIARYGYAPSAEPRGPLAGWDATNSVTPGGDPGWQQAQLAQAGMNWNSAPRPITPFGS